MKLDEGEYLAHYGILRKSGRYPWGSGANPLQRSKTFLDIVEEHKKSGMTEAQIAKAYSTKEHPFSVAALRSLKSRAVNIRQEDRIRTAQKLRDKGMGASEIAKQMGVNESSVRSLLAPGRQDKFNITKATADMLRRQVDEKGFIDVGGNVERDLPIGDNPETRIGISKDKFAQALSTLKEEGYPVHTVRIQQVGTGEFTKYLVLTKPGNTQKDVFLNRDKIQLITAKSDDRGRTYNTDLGIQPPLNINSKRIAVRYKEDGGADADGVIYVRPGVPDVSMGKSQYAQVRIAVDGSHYLKGMAVYKDDLPAGIDLMFNTNKSNTGNKLDAMKTLKEDPDNPFGAQIKQNGGQLLDKHGRVSSALNKINEEGDWSTWSNTLSRQVLSKQSPDLAKRQLDVTYERRQKEFEELKNLTNPLIRKKLLETFGDETDSAAVNLRAAAMPRQATKVILPSNHVKPTEIFAPTFKDGERVALVRFPHAGTFEIPELTVNNRSREARKLVGLGKGGTAPDAVIIHPKVAERLSGADFDGDHVLVIPNQRGDIQSTHPLDQLKGFDPQIYKVPLGPKTKEHPDGTPIITASAKEHEMGNITNLIADMTIRGANSEEKARAVRHSMVVIDAEKHNLDFRASYRDHAILELKRKYQEGAKPGQPGGASTLITKAKSPEYVNQRKPRPAAEGGPIDRATGKRVFVETKATKPDGTLIKTRSTRLAETDDAHSLSSGTRIESLYADHANRLKTMANEARRVSVHTEVPKRNPSAAKVYKDEVDSLDHKLDIALKNSPLERQAQVVAGRIYSQKVRANPKMDGETKRKIKAQALSEARLRTGAGKDRIKLTPREWEAIQAKAISGSKLDAILRNSDLETIRKFATPRVNRVMTPAVSARAKQMLASGYTLAEVADHLGVNLSTLKSSVAGEEVS